MLDANCTTNGNALELFRVVPSGSKGLPRGPCESCGRQIWSDGGYRLPGIPGIYCAAECIEAILFGQGRCRRCGAKMAKPYASVDSRLCSEDCSANYYGHVLGDRTAALGTGKRLLLWLQSNQPEVYRQVVGLATSDRVYCRNPRCPNGTDGKPATLEHFRAGTLYCSDACKKQAQRSPNRQKSASKTSFFIEFSRDTLPGKAFPVNPGIPAHFEALKGVLR